MHLPVLFNLLFIVNYEAYVKSKFRYKIYLAMNDVTSMLYVSLVRQFETLLFYVVTSRVEALAVSCRKFLNACVEKVYRLLLQPIFLLSFPPLQFHKNIDFQSQSGAQFSVTHSEKNSDRSVMVKRLFSRIFTSICCTRSGVTTLGRRLRLSSCTLS